jgi:hypothetical protein
MLKHLCLYLIVNSCKVRTGQAYLLFHIYSTTQTRSNTRYELFFTDIKIFKLNSLVLSEIHHILVIHKEKHSIFNRKNREKVDAINYDLKQITNEVNRELCKINN